jgi:gamma-glutamylcyclotransferase (GGCT)/AIG2-like uncharacterized protein YtfP
VRAIVRAEIERGKVGTLREKGVKIFQASMRDRSEIAEACAKDTLIGYKLFSIEIKDKSFLSKGEQKYQQTAVLSKDNSETVEGAVFEISKEELLSADKYEPDNYERIKIRLQSGKEAWIYIAVKTTLSDKLQ